MISIKKATIQNAKSIADIGRIAVYEAHEGSCSTDDLIHFINHHYHEGAILQELADEQNNYYLMFDDETPIGFSKIIFNAAHPNIKQKNVTKLDRIYLLKEYHGLKLGRELLEFNIQQCKSKQQTGIWLFTWVGNAKAIQFYQRAGFQIIGSHQFKITENHYNPNHQLFLQVA